MLRWGEGISSIETIPPEKLTIEGCLLAVTSAAGGIDPLFLNGIWAAHHSNHYIRFSARPDLLASVTTDHY